VKGDALAKGLEAQPWDPSVKSLVNFPQVLAMMGEKLDWTQKLGDAFLAQQKDVMGTVQNLRAKAQASGNLKTTKEQVVKVEQETIIIEPASPQVIYVPAYNPTVVYGAWAYPAYPPYPVYPAGYVATTAAFSFMAGAAVGAAWGYAWGHSNWHGGEVNVNVNQNTNINNTSTGASTRTKLHPAKGARASGSMTPATAVESPTGIRELRRSTTGEDRGMHSHGMRTGAVRSREDRTSPRTRQTGPAVASKWIVGWFARSDGPRWRPQRRGSGRERDQGSQ